MTRKNNTETIHTATVDLTVLKDARLGGRAFLFAAIMGSLEFRLIVRGAI